ncbi:MAG: hypothetical protein ACW98D_20050 [Promethearchaeota archaeon]|jgi:hypothetical protein
MTVNEVIKALQYYKETHKDINIGEQQLLIEYNKSEQYPKIIDRVSTSNPTYLIPEFFKIYVR